MPKYRAIYKCRMCGEEIVGVTICDKEDVEIQMKNTCVFSSDFFNPKTAHRENRAIPHMCKDGSYGLAEFLGFRKVEAKDENVRNS